MTDHVLKLHGLKCPLPVLKTRKALAAMPVGELIRIECTDQLAAIDIPNFVQQAGHTLEGFDTTNGGVLIFRIRKSALKPVQGQ